MDEWRPIDSAPKEHALEILVTGRGAMAVVMWLSRDCIQDGEEDDFTSGWYISDGKNEPQWYRGWTSLTHWMPLPEPPQGCERR